MHSLQWLEERRGWGRHGVPITRSVVPSPGTTDWFHTMCRVRDNHLGCFASERSQQALHDGLLRRTELFGAAFGEATQNGQRGQAGLGRQPVFDVGEVRIGFEVILIRVL